MTVSSSTNKIIGNGNGVTTSWPFSFKVFDPGHLVVTYTDAAGDETTLDPGQYVVTLNADQDASPGGTVSYSPAIASGTKLTLLRSVPYTQTIDIKNQGGFFPEVLERGFDLMVMQVQQLKEQLARAFKLSPSQSAIGELEASDANRANTYVGFDNSGNLSLYTGVASGTAVSVAMAPVVSAASLSAGRVAFAVPGLGDNNTFSGTQTFSGAVSFAQPATPLASLRSFVKPGHRLSLTSAVAVTIADATAAGTIYWTPHEHNLTPIHNGAAWINAAVTEKSFILDATNHLSGKNYDFFLDYNAGAPRVVTGPAWTNDTTRADAISRDATYGYYVNTTAMTGRVSNNGGTVSLSAGAALYLGTIRCAANGQTEDSAAKRFVWNMFNRVPRPMRVVDSTDAWSYASATIRQARANAVNQLDMVRGLDEDSVICTVLSRFANDTVNQAGFVHIGLDSTTTPATGCLMNGGGSATVLHAMPTQAHWVGHPGLGRHFLAWLESSSGGTSTFSGDAGAPTYVQSGIGGEVMA